jgi:hypothetical protein
MPNDITQNVINGFNFTSQNIFGIIRSGKSHLFRKMQRIQVIYEYALNCYKVTQSAEICHFETITQTVKINSSAHFTSADGKVPYGSDYKNLITK